MFLAHFRESGNVRAAAQAAGVSRQMAYLRREADPDFAQAWDAAEEEATDVLVAEARRRALDASDTLLIFLLKSHRPAVYREKFDVTHQGRIAHDHRPDLSRLSLDELHALEALALHALPDASPSTSAEPVGLLPGPDGDSDGAR